jgi:hypothetical protein
MLPLVGRQADMWNTGAGRGLDTFKHKRDIVINSAVAAGRQPSDIVVTVTREAPLPTNSAESENWLSFVHDWSTAGVDYFLLDFGHVTATDPVLRFVDEVIRPAKAGR